MSDAFSHRLARLDDVALLKPLMETSIRTLLKPYLSTQGVEASFSIMGLDSQLIEDGTYYVVQAEGRIAGCGGWSRRATLFGGDHFAGRSQTPLDPAKDAARVRAMYTHPDFARRGIGRLILEVCERAAAAEGFAALELAATLAGLPLYRSYGFDDVERFEELTPSGIRVPLVKMRKAIAPANRA